MRLDLAAAYLATGQPDQAEAELQTVIDTIAPDSIAARMALIDVYRAKGDLDKIVAEGQKLLEENPDNTGVKLGLARGLLLSGKVDEAETLARNVLTAPAGLGLGQFHRGRLSGGTGMRFRKPCPCSTRPHTRCPTREAVLATLGGRAFRQASHGSTPDRRRGSAFFRSPRTGGGRTIHGQLASTCGSAASCGNCWPNVKRSREQRICSLQETLPSGRVCFPTTCRRRSNWPPCCPRKTRFGPYIDLIEGMDPAKIRPLFESMDPKRNRNGRCCARTPWDTHSPAPGRAAGPPRCSPNACANGRRKRGWRT